ncbi:MAG: diguanylate cyclase [Pseudomonadota bacterium]
MSSPEFPPAQEASRLRTIAALGLIDTPPDRAFDALAALAARLLDCPIGLVSLVEQDRQWIKAASGTTMSESARRDAFCNHTIAGSGPFVIDDATADGRFSTNPLVTGGPEIRAYAGIPISARDPEGGGRVAVGAVCAIDTVPRAFSPEQHALLAHLRSLAEALFDARTLQLQAEAQSEALRRSDRVSRQAERIAEMGTWHLDLSDESVVWSDGVYRIHEVAPGTDPNLQAALDFYPDHARATVSQALAATMDTGAPFDIEVDFITARGRKRRVRSMGELELRAGQPVAVIGVFQDVTERHAIEESLRRSASIDELTRIANRAAFNTELERAVASATAGDAALGLILIDGDHFKAINDTHGHLVGDDVLRAFGRRLRRVDPQHCFAARLGGDEFGLIVTGRAAGQISATVDRLLAELKMPVHSVDGVIQVSATIGHACFQAGEASVRDFIHRADVALYEAKRIARGSACAWGDLRGRERRAA